MAIQIIDEDKEMLSQELLYDHYMFEIQKRMVDIGMLREDNKPINESVTEMFLLCKKLVEINGIDQELLASKLKEIEETVSKITQ